MFVLYYFIETSSFPSRRGRFTFSPNDENRRGFERQNDSLGANAGRHQYSHSMPYTTVSFICCFFSPQKVLRWASLRVASVHYTPVYLPCRHTPQLCLAQFPCCHTYLWIHLFIVSCLHACFSFLFSVSVYQFIRSHEIMTILLFVGFSL